MNNRPYLRNIARLPLYIWINHVLLLCCTPARRNSLCGRSSAVKCEAVAKAPDLEQHRYMIPVLPCHTHTPISVMAATHNLLVALGARNKERSSLSYGSG